MRAIPDELSTLISDIETFLSDGLKGENLSKKVKEKKESIIKRIKEIKNGYPQDFKEKNGEDSFEEEEMESNHDGASVQSERTDKDEDTPECTHQSPPVAAQELQSVFKAGNLEKRRKDHSFFGTEWQKRWCALSQHTFYYYGSDKDKQQKGDFGIEGYTVKMNNTLRKDSKKDCCFEISAPDKRVYQFCASSQKEAQEWVEHIDFVLKGMSGEIPLDEDNQPTYDDIDHPAPLSSEHVNDGIYEELPEVALPSKPSPALPPVNKCTDYANYYQGKWDCNGDHPDELTFKRGDAIYILSKEYQNFGWWVGEMKGSIGIVPKDFLMKLYAI